MRATRIPTLTSASARCCLTCRPVLKHCCHPRQDRRQVLGSLRSQPSRPQRSHRPAGDNLYLCTATPAGHPMAAEAQLTASAITHSRARAQDSSPGGLRSWSEPGCGSPGKRWGRKGKSFRSSGWPTPPPCMSERRTVAGSTWSCTGR